VLESKRASGGGKRAYAGALILLLLSIDMVRIRALSWRTRTSLDPQECCRRGYVDLEGALGEDELVEPSTAGDALVVGPVVDYGFGGNDSPHIAVRRIYLVGLDLASRPRSGGRCETSPGSE
jgi:hypothetical protein